MGFIHITPEMTAGELVVGIGTLALAGFTAWLAWRTSAEVTASEEQIRLSRESIEAQERPFIVASGNTTANGALRFLDKLFFFGISNMGKGAAVVEGVVFQTSSGENLFDSPLESIPVVAPDSAVNLRMPSARGTPNTGTELTLRVWYRSASGSRYLSESRLEVGDRGYCQSRGHRRTNVSG